MASYSLWVGGGEINSHYLTRQDAEYWAQQWIELGYEDVAVKENHNG
jgi:hypothetical protein